MYLLNCNNVSEFPPSSGYINYALKKNVKKLRAVACLRHRVTYSGLTQRRKRNAVLNFQGVNALMYLLRIELQQVQRTCSQPPVNTTFFTMALTCEETGG